MAKSYSYPTQIAWACHALLNGREICQKDQIIEIGGWRLPAIIFNLRYEYGWNIKTIIDDNKIAYFRLDQRSNRVYLGIPPSYDINKNY